MKFLNKNNKGFTLTELLIVIAIITILMIVAVPSLMKNIDKAHAADITEYITAVRSEAIIKYAEGNYYNQRNYDEEDDENDFDENGVKKPSVRNAEDINTLITGRPSNSYVKRVAMRDSGGMNIKVFVRNQNVKREIINSLNLDNEGYMGDSNQPDRLRIILKVKSRWFWN